LVRSVAGAIIILFGIIILSAPYHHT